MTNPRFLGAALLFAAWMAMPAQAQESAQPPGEMPMDEEMQAWMQAGMVGEHHKHLEYVIGNWKAESKWWMSEDADAEPMVSPGTLEAKWVLDGRFATYTYRGDMMGMPFEGIGFVGFDNIRKQYVSIWMDSMSTMIMQDYGDYDAASKTFTYLGEFKDPMGKTYKSRHTIKVVDKDKHVMTFHHKRDDWPDFRRVGEITYTRAAEKSGE